MEVGMSDNKVNRIMNNRPGFFNDLLNRLKLVVRLIGDRRINLLLKGLPVFALVYLISPIDLAFGPIDDAVVIWLCLTLFVELCPPEIVKEHIAALNKVVPGQWHDPSPAETQPKPSDEEIIDAEFHEIG
jgi:uncharacterized membrane protein YkvA (DUF1232 family)